MRNSGHQRLKIIACHNFYQQAGGEDQVYAEEVALLRDHGHAVVEFTMDNDAIDGASGIRPRLALLGNTLWNRSAYRKLRELVRRERPGVVHFHNTFPLMSPAAYYAARAGGAAVVQTLHNYRLLCPAATFYRDGNVCEDCLGKALPLPAVRHACYRGSRSASAATAGLLAAHRAIGTYRGAVDLYVALTEFARRKFVEGGLPASKVATKPNFVGVDRGAGDGTGGFALFVGRLDVTKGLDVLVRAWAQVGGGARLKILGDGPEAALVRAAAERDPRIEWLGRKPLDEVYRVMGEASCLVVPSLWYEGFPRTIVESFSKGTPVLTSRHGSLAELIDQGRTGLHFAVGDAQDLARQIEWAFANPHALDAMRRAVRAEYVTKYTAEENYRQLLALYDRAIATRSMSQEAA